MLYIQTANPLGHSFFKIVSLFGDNTILITVTTIVVFMYLYLNNYKKNAIFVVFSLLSIPYSFLLKGIFHMERPLTARNISVFLNPFFNSYSFPSSHVVFYTSFFGFLLYLTFAIKKLGKVLKYLVRIICLIFTGFIGISRIALGMHWVTDVIGGYVFGLLFLAGLIFLSEKIKNSGTKNNNANN